jgi:hypothetical protein
LTLQSQYIFSLLVFVVKNRSYFTFNSDIHDINTRFNQNLNLPSTNLTLVQKGVFLSGSKIYNQLPLRIKMLYKDITNFKSSLRTYLIEHAFYSIDEYYQLPSQWLAIFMHSIVNFISFIHSSPLYLDLL